MTDRRQHAPPSGLTEDERRFYLRADCHLPGGGTVTVDRETLRTILRVLAAERAQHAALRVRAAAVLAGFEVLPSLAAAEVVGAAMELDALRALVPGEES